MTSPDGTRYLYGSRPAANSKLDNAGRQPDLPLATFRWSLDKVIDPRGNWYEIDYAYETFTHPQPNGVPSVTYNMNNHPVAIRYSYHASEPGPRDRRIVSFQWGMRGEADYNDDRPTSYRSGFKVQISERLTDILVGIDSDQDGVIDERVRRYEFLYNPKPFWGDPDSEALPSFSQLAAIQRYGKTDVDKFPSRTDFNYTQPPRAHQGGVTYWQHPSTTHGVDFTRVGYYPDGYYYAETRSAVQDMNGDGFVDFVWWSGDDESVPEPDRNKLWVAYGPVRQGGSFADEQTDWGFAEPVLWQTPDPPPLGLKVTAIYGPPTNIYEQTETSSELIDMDGDGLPDLVGFGNPIGLNVARNLGNGFGPWEAWGVTGHYLEEIYKAACTEEGLPCINDAGSIVTTLVDVNGDGLPDLVSGDNGGQEFDQYGDRNQVWVWVNTGDSLDPPVLMALNDFWLDDMNDLGVRYKDTNGRQITDAMFADANGDGLADQFGKEMCLGAPRTAFSLGNGWQTLTRTGQGFHEDAVSVDPADRYCDWSYVLPPLRPEGLNFYGTINALIDLNGDGINDLYHGFHASQHGSGAGGQIDVDRSVWFGLGDGTYLMLSDESLFPQYTNIPPGVTWASGLWYGEVRLDVAAEFIGWMTGMRSSDTIDMNGDGLVDQVRFGAPGFTGLEQAGPWYEVYLHPGPEGLLETVKNELGGVTRLTYKPSTWFRKVAAAATGGEGEPEPTLPASVRTAPPQWLLASVTLEDGRTTNDQTQSIEYAKPRYDTERHEYLGARMAESVDASSVLTRRFFHQIPELRGRLEFMEVEDAEEGVLRTEKTTWTSVPTPGESGTVPGSSFAKPTETQTVLRDPANGSVQIHGISRTFDDATGNLLTETDWGADGVQGTADDRVRALTYAPTPSGDWMTSYVTEDSLYFGNIATQNRVSSVQFHYDTSTPGGSTGPIRCTGSGPPCGGQVSFRETLRETGSNTWATEHWQYDPYGNVTQYFDPETYAAFTSDPNTPPTQTTLYDDSGAFPETVTNALGHAWNYRFDEGLGQVTRILEPNGQLACRVYDGFGRLSQRRDHSTPVAPANIESSCDTLLASFAFNDASLGFPAQQHILETLETGEMDPVRRLRFFDGLGREYQTEDEYKPGEFDVVKRSWGDRGELVCQTLPYRRSGGVSGWSTAEACDDLDPVSGRSHRITAHDALLRPTQVDLVGKDEQGTFQSVTELVRSYGVDSWAGSDPGLGDLAVEKRETLTGQAWDRTQYIGRNARGEVVFLREDGDDAQTTILERDPKGRITRVDGPDFALESGVDENLLDITYNAVDQRRTLSQPQTGAGGGVAPWQYLYNLNGDLALQISPRGVGTQFFYDELGRLVVRDYAPFDTLENPGAGDVVYEYHDSGYGLGRLASAYLVGGMIVTDYDYDLRGRLASKARHFGYPPYAFGYSYDLLDRPSVTTLPDLSTLTYTYESGALAQLQSTLPNAGGVDVLIDQIEHNANGGLESLRAQALSLSGPPLQTDCHYRPTDDRLEQVVTTVDPGGVNPDTIQDLFYDYDTAGNLLTVDDLFDRLDQTFTYDPLHRLDTASGQGSRAYGLLQYEYDDAGNLLGRGPGTNASPANGRIRLAYDRPANGGPPSAVRVGYYNGSEWLGGFGALDYDADGAMIRRRVVFTTWDQPNGRDAAGRIYYTQLPGWPKPDAYYFYDHTGERFERATNLGFNLLAWHQYVDAGYEADWFSSTHDVHLFVDGRRVATAKRPGRGYAETSPTEAVHFHLTDHVGSNRLVVDASGQVIQETFLKPFGVVYALLDAAGQPLGNADDSVTPYLFTDQERDPETDLHYFGARYYDPLIGRFLSQDPELIGYEPGVTFGRIGRDPQQFNAYSYVRNSPTVFADPTGAFSLPGGDRERCLGGICFGLVVSSSVQVGAGVSTNPVAAAAALGFLTVSYVAWLNTAVTGNDTTWNLGLSTVYAHSADDGQQHSGDDLDARSEAGKEADKNGRTKAGRAIEKHGGREGSAFPKPSGGPDQINEAGQDALDDILTDPGTTTSPNRFGGTDYTAPDGRGARFGPDGGFRGFLEP